MKKYTILNFKTIVGWQYTHCTKSIKVFVFTSCSILFVLLNTMSCKKLNSTNPIYYIVQFNSNGGSVVDSIRIVSGGKVTKPVDPTLTNYTFDGWYTEQGLVQIFNFQTSITANITLYAKWKLKTGITYNVIFNSNGGTKVDTQRVVLGNQATRPTDPTRSGFIFVGWYNDASLNQVFDFNTAITANITLYAKWENKDLAGIILFGRIPTDLANYDKLSQDILKYYLAGATLTPFFVTQNGAGDNSGKSWANARSAAELEGTISSIADANKNKVYIVLIGAGTYIVGIKSLSLKNNVVIVGGFPATGGWTRTSADSTVLSGNNTSRVFYNNGVNNTAQLYGVTISKGYVAVNTSFSFDGGAGMRNDNASPTINNVIFSDNHVVTHNLGFDNGGAMLNQNNSSPILTNVIFQKNSAHFFGGGMYNGSSFPILNNVAFISNSANQGGAIFGDATLINTVFIGNSADEGGGVSTTGTSIIVNAIFWGNTATTSNPQYKSSNITYSVIEGATASATIKTDNPNLSALTYSPGYVMPTISYTGTSPDNLGVYVRRTKIAPYIFYYSTDGTKWYVDPTTIGTGTAANVPADAIDLTATDIQGRPHTGRPNAGVWAK